MRMRTTNKMVPNMVFLSLGGTLQPDAQVPQSHAPDFPGWENLLLSMRKDNAGDGIGAMGCCPTTTRTPQRRGGEAGRLIMKTKQKPPNPRKKNHTYFFALHPPPTQQH